MKKIYKPILTSKNVGYIGRFAFLNCLYDNHFAIRGSHDCKEEFTRRFNKRTQYLLIYHHSNNHVSIFLEEIQDKLKLQKKDRLHIVKFQNNENASLVQVSKWWRYNSIRREFLAVMLQNASKWQSKYYNFNAILYSGYINRLNAKKAVDSFLKGATHYIGYIGGSYGWYCNFAGGFWGNFNRLFRMFY